MIVFDFKSQALAHVLEQLVEFARHIVNHVGPSTSHEV